MNEDLKQIKKKYGEDMMHFCRDNLSVVLETPGLLPSILEKKFAPNHGLYYEIDQCLMQDHFIDLILEDANLKEKKEKVVTDKTPEEIFEELGYTLYECHSEEEINRFLKYYAPGEELCTFGRNRLSTHHVFFAVSNNAEDLRREDFTNPKREDVYGTSVMSIQFTRGNHKLLSIKNRYNHTVDYPDSTYSNNLENIYPGLTYAFTKHDGFNIRQKDDEFEVDTLVLADDNRYYPFFSEFNDIYYGPDNYIVSHGRLQEQYLEKEKYLIFDYFILDLVKKEVFLFDDLIDSFPSTLQNIEDIEIKKDSKNKKKYIYIKQKGLDEKVIIVLNHKNQMMEYINNNVTEIEDNFLYNSDSLQCLTLDKVVRIGKNFLRNNTDLKHLSLKQVRTIGSYFLPLNIGLIHLTLENLEELGDFALEYNSKILYVNLPKVFRIGDGTLTNANSLETLYMPKAETIGLEFIEHNDNINFALFLL